MTHTADHRLQNRLPWSEFAERRGRLLEAIGREAVAVIASGPETRGYELPRQTNEFSYVCGLGTTHAYLLLNGADRSTRLFLPARPSGRPADAGPLAADDRDTICGATGLDDVCRVEALATHLAAAKVIFAPHAPAEGWKQARDVLTYANRLAAEDPWDGALPREVRFLGLLRARCPRAEVRDLTPILDRLRLVKSPGELDLVRCASQLAARAVAEAMRATRPGVMEYHLDAIAQFVYMAGGARGEGYRSIIPGGANIWDAHYFRNDQPLKDGDLVLMDTAPEVAGYTSDIGRLWPVNGRYAPWQRELYGFMVDFHRTLLGLIRPGRLAEQIRAEAAARMRARLEATTFSKPAYRAAAERALEFRGHLSHPVGLAVHDVGNYHAGPLVPGTVFAIDPQLWVPEEKLYIRCEDTVAVTASGVEVLTGAAPLGLDETEAVVGTGSALPLSLG